MKRNLLLLSVLGLMLAPAASAQALSCAPPEPIDWERTFSTLDGAYIVRVDSVEQTGEGDNRIGGSIQITATVVAVLKGSVQEDLQYTVANFEPWGPYYEMGDEVAVTITNGVVTDGRQNICGPWYEPDELRRAAAEYGDLEAPVPAARPEPGSWNFLLELLRLILAVLGR